MKLLQRLCELCRDLSEAECSRSEAWRRIARLPVASTELASPTAGLADLSTALKTSSIQPEEV